MLVVGIIASVLLAAGLLPPYGEIWKRRGRVVGINWVCSSYPNCASSSSTSTEADMCWQIFLTMDWNGAFFSLMALGTCITLLPN